MQNGQARFEITKANGEKFVFDHNKLFSSLTRSQADETQAYEIVDAITAQLYPGISAKKIYKQPRTISQPLVPRSARCPFAHIIARPIIATYSKNSIRSLKGLAESQVLRLQKKLGHNKIVRETLSQSLIVDHAGIQVGGNAQKPTSKNL
jgi:hypothetical protein